MAWTSSDRRARLPSNWPALVKATKARAGGRCEATTNGIRCNAPGTDCDHKRRGDDHRPSNLQWLCRPHHKTKTQAEAAAARHPNRKRPTPRHPST